MRLINDNAEVLLLGPSQLPL